MYKAAVELHPFPTTLPRSQVAEKAWDRGCLHTREEVPQLCLPSASLSTEGFFSFAWVHSKKKLFLPTEPRSYGGFEDRQFCLTEDQWSLLQHLILCCFLNVCNVLGICLSFLNQNIKVCKWERRGREGTSKALYN